MNFAVKFFFIGSFICTFTSCKSKTSRNFSTPDESQQQIGQHTLDISRDLSKIMEKEKLAGSCERHFSRIDNQTYDFMPKFKGNLDAEKDMILCGKFEFLYSGMDVALPIPSSQLKSMTDMWPEITGPAFTKLGFHEDPNDKGFPVGLPPAKALDSKLKFPNSEVLRTNSCAICHVGKLPDGRYAIGMPNENLNMGLYNLIMMYPLWLADSKKNDESIWPKKTQDYFDQLWRSSFFKFKPSRAIIDLSLLPAWFGKTKEFYDFIGIPRPSRMELEGLVEDRVGAPNQLMLVLGGNKKVFMMPSQFWNISNRQGEVEAGKASMLTNFIPSSTIEHFLEAAFIIQNSTDKYSNRKYSAPLAAYIRTLKTPRPEKEDLDHALALKGQNIFQNKCISCHSTENGDGARRVRSSEINAPLIYDGPTSVGFQPMNSVSIKTWELLKKYVGADMPTQLNGMKVRRLNGIWTRNRLMSSGSIQGLDHAFCINKTRTAGNENDPFSELIHNDLCTGYSLADRRALKEFLKKWY